MQRSAALPLIEHRTLAAGAQWRVREVLCRAGPQTPRFEECHAWTGVAVVVSGSFSYRGDRGRALLVPGALLLANAGACFECGHEHGAGDRCIAFQFAPELAGPAFRGTPRFDLHSIPPVDDTLPLTARALGPRDPAGWEDLACSLLDSACAVAAGVPRRTSRDTQAVSAITRLARELDAEPGRDWNLEKMAEVCGVDRFRLIRAFRRQFGTTPYRYVLRQRIELAARRLRRDSGSVQTIALESGFNDLSEFTRRFRRLFGLTPSEFRRRG